MIVSDIVREIKKQRNIAIIAHVNPDGDAIGSVLAFGLALKKLKKNIVLVKNDEFPGKYRFLPGQDMFIYPNVLQGPIDVLVVLDCGDAERLGNAAELLEKAQMVVNIDHHISNTMFGNLNFVDTNAAATAEIVYQIIKLTGAGLDLDIATCLYTAIVADTGCFRYDNTTQITHTICGELISLGVNSSEICYRLFHERTIPQLKLLGRTIDSMQVHHKGKTAVMIVTEEMMKDTGANHGDLENVIEFARDAAGVEVAVLLKRLEDGSVKVGFRAKKDADVSLIAMHFGGGGHKKASGCTIDGPIDKALQRVLEEIEKAYGKEE